MNVNRIFFTEIKKENRGLMKHLQVRRLILWFAHIELQQFVLTIPHFPWGSRLRDLVVYWFNSYSIWTQLSHNPNVRPVTNLSFFLITIKWNKLAGDQWKKSYLQGSCNERHCRKEAWRNSIPAKRTSEITFREAFELALLKKTTNIVKRQYQL